MTAPAAAPSMADIVARYNAVVDAWTKSGDSLRAAIQAETAAAAANHARETEAIDAALADVRQTIRAALDVIAANPLWKRFAQNTTDGGALAAPSSELSPLDVGDEPSVATALARLKELRYDAVAARGKLPGFASLFDRSRLSPQQRTYLQWSILDWRAHGACGAR